MKRKLMLFAAFGAMLASCNGGGEWIDCYSVNGYAYAVDASPVQEYQAADGSSIYTNVHSYETINVYPDHASDNYIVYNYVRFVGNISKETSYRVNLATRTIDTITKYLERAQEDKGNNKEAYQKAKTGYYNLYEYGSSPSTVFLNPCDTSLERHSYQVVGLDDTIKYVIMP